MEKYYDTLLTKAPSSSQRVQGNKRLIVIWDVQQEIIAVSNDKKSNFQINVVF